MEPGSPDIRLFARWCRSRIDEWIAEDEVPALLIADGPDFEVVRVLEWRLGGEWPTAEELFEYLLSAWAETSGGSQLGISLPAGEDRPGVRLLVVNEASVLYERALADLERIRLGAWSSLALSFDLADLQVELAKNAGWKAFAKWRCRQCQSVCPGEADERPSPCEFCGSIDIESAPLAASLRDPDAPFANNLWSYSSAH